MVSRRSSLTEHFVRCGIQSRSRSGHGVVFPPADCSNRLK